LIRDHHPAYITWEDYERNQAMLMENAHSKKCMGRKSARGGRALLTGLVRCGRCGRMMRVVYGMTSGHAHSYVCRGDEAQASGKRCIGIGGVRVDQAVAAQLVEVVAPHAVDAAIDAAARATRADDDVRIALGRQLEEAKYEASIAARRHAAIDPDKRHVARELEARWEAALTHVAELEERVAHLDRSASPPRVDRATLMTLARDLPAVWNAPATDPRTKQRLARIVVHEVVLDRDDALREVRVTIHWTGGRHTELRVQRVSERYEDVDGRPSAVDVIRKIGEHFSDRDMAATMNRMRCTGTASSWTTDNVRALRERLGIPPFAPDVANEMISLNEAARRLDIATDSAPPHPRRRATGHPGDAFCAVARACCCAREGRRKGGGARSHRSTPTKLRNAAGQEDAPSARRLNLQAPSLLSRTSAAAASGQRPRRRVARARCRRGRRPRRPRREPSLLSSAPAEPVGAQAPPNDVARGAPGPVLILNVISSPLQHPSTGRATIADQQIPRQPR
jgi:hypothetical protein